MRYTHSMSKRLQVVIDEQEYRLLERQAREAHLSLGEWVRQQLRKSQIEVSRRTAAQKLAAIARAGKHSFPSGSIEKMLAEIERGYQTGKV